MLMLSCDQHDHKLDYFFYREDNGQWVEEQKLDSHSDWVRDVAWAPSIGLPKSVIASCSQVSPSILRKYTVKHAFLACMYFSRYFSSPFN